MILIPLTKQQSRGDQLLNAASFERSGYCKVLREESLNKQSFMTSIQEVFENKNVYIKNMSNFAAKDKDALTAVCDWIADTAKK